MTRKGRGLGEPVAKPVLRRFCFLRWEMQKKQFNLKLFAPFVLTGGFLCLLVGIFLVLIDTPVSASNNPLTVGPDTPRIQFDTGDTAVCLAKGAPATASGSY